MSKSTLEDLSFLDVIFPDLEDLNARRYQSPDWLVGDFDKPQWTCVFGRFTTRLDWDVQLGSSGGRLIAAEHGELWTALRCWLAVSVHPDVQGGALWSDATRKARFQQTIDLIDLLLLRADRLAGC